MYVAIEFLLNVLNKLFDSKNGKIRMVNSFRQDANRLLKRNCYPKLWCLTDSTNLDLNFLILKTNGRKCVWIEYSLLEANIMLNKR